MLLKKINKCSHTAGIAEVAVHRLIVKALQTRNQYFGLMRKAVKHVCGLHISKGSVIMARVCILYVVNLTIMTLYTILNITSVFMVDDVVRCIMTAQTKFVNVLASVNH